METFLEILKFTLPALIAVITAYIVLHNLLNNFLKTKQLDLVLQKQKDIVPIRLQAFERIVLYLERISPTQLITRLLEPELNAVQFHYALVTSVKAEYEHNITQQLYISNENWLLVRNATEETISILNSLATQVAPDGPATDLARIILVHITENEELPTQRALNLLKAEAREMFFF